jgi:UDP-glucose 4-epimerase
VAAGPPSFDANVKGRRVVVTGADGFIGSHLVEACVRAGARVRALAQYTSFDGDGWLDDLDVRSDVEVVRGDVRDPDQMRALIRGTEVVFHLAALIAIPYSYVAPTAYIDTNVKGSLNVFLAARDAGCGRVVHTSTSEVYGTAQVRPMTENHPLIAQSPYAASKIAADKLAEAMFLSFGLPVVTLRPFNTYGPRQSERAVIATAIRQALDPACPEVRLGDLTPERDFTYVADTVRAFLAAAGAAPGGVYNCGTGRCVTIGGLSEAILRAVGCAKPIATEAARLRPAGSEVRALQADSTRLTQATGWRPGTSLTGGLAATVAWWRSRPLDGSGGYRV